MARQDSSISNSSVVTAVPLGYKLPATIEHDVPIVSYLGPVSSYTHQVYTLVQFFTPAWLLGLTDYDLAQAALQCFDSDQYDYKPATTIPGYPQNPVLTPQTSSNVNMLQMSSKQFNQEKQLSASYHLRIPRTGQLSSPSSSSQIVTIRSPISQSAEKLISMSVTACLVARPTL
jgi:hypothetical protein